MKEQTAKNYGRIVCYLLAGFILLFSTHLYASEISSELNRTTISIGDTAVLKVMISGEASDITPVKVPAVDGLKISYTGSSKSFQFVNGNVWSGIILNFSVFAERSGSYKIPPFVIKAGGTELVSQELTLLVRDGAPSDKRVPASAFMRGEVELSSSKAYAGEPVVMRYYVYLSGGRPFRIDGFREQPHVKGFILTEVDEKIPPSIEISEGIEYEKIHAGTFLITPAAEGVYTVGGGNIVVTVDGGRGFFSFPEQRQLAMPRREIKISAISLRGAPSGFRGALGDFVIESDFSVKEARLFEEVKFQIIVRGRGNLTALHQPVVSGMEGARVIVDEGAPDFYLHNNIPEGSRVYSITIVPEKAGPVKGGFFLPYYNPYTGKYETAETASVYFEAIGDNAAAAAASKITSSDGERFPLLNYILTGFAIFLFSAAGLYLFIRDWRSFRGTISSNGAEVKERSAASAAASAADSRADLVRELVDARDRGDRDTFLRSAAKLIHISESMIGGADFEAIKDKVHLCRYAGAPLTDDEMKKIYDLLKRD